MGTRGLNVIISGNEVKVALYNQFDSYPSGLGVDVLNVLKALQNREEFVRKVKQCSWIEEDELMKLWELAGAEPGSEFVSLEVSERFNEMYPWLYRECGAKIYEYINASPNGLKTKNSIEFAADSLFCEWAYVVDLDKGVFEIYKGFNQEPLGSSERFAFLQKKKASNQAASNSVKPGSGKEKYYPVKFVKSYSLDALPAPKEFVEFFNNEE